MRALNFAGRFGLIVFGAGGVLPMVAGFLSGGLEPELFRFWMWIVLGSGALFWMTREAGSRAGTVSPRRPLPNRSTASTREERFEEFEDLLDRIHNQDREGLDFSTLDQKAQAKPTPIATTSPVTYGGGDGSTEGEALVVLGARTRTEGIAAEYDYLRMRYGKQEDDWFVERKDLVFSDDRPLDVFDIRLRMGERISVHFDTSKFFWLGS